MPITGKLPYVYIAGPFFNPKQVERVEMVKAVCEEAELKYFSPKDECMFEPGKTTPEDVLNINLDALKKTQLLLCITDDRDVGTMFEAGWCHAKDIAIIYIWLDGLPGQKFNLMLGASGSVVRDVEQLKAALKQIHKYGRHTRKNWGEDLDHE